MNINSTTFRTPSFALKEIATLIQPSSESTPMDGSLDASNEPLHTPLLNQSLSIDDTTYEITSEGIPSMKILATRVFIRNCSDSFNLIKEKGIDLNEIYDLIYRAQLVDSIFINNKRFEKVLFNEASIEVISKVSQKTTLGDCLFTGKCLYDPKTKLFMPIPITKCSVSNKWFNTNQWGIYHSVQDDDFMMFPLGKGSIETSDGRIEIGTWGPRDPSNLEGPWRLTGEGRMKFSNGLIHSGTWGPRDPSNLEGPWILTGKGSVKFSNGLIHSGTWGPRDPSNLEGPWILTGKGSIETSDGRIGTGTWGKKDPSNLEGPWILTGKGSIKLSSGTIQTGTWGPRDPSNWMGEWVLTGEGRIETSDGRIWTGTWGPKDPSNLEGPWRLTGKGSIETPDGRIETGTWGYVNPGDPTSWGLLDQEHQDHHDPTSVTEINSERSSLKSRKRKTGNIAIKANNQKKFKK